MTHAYAYMYSTTKSMNLRRTTAAASSRRIRRQDRLRPLPLNRRDEAAQLLRLQRPDLLLHPVDLTLHIHKARSSLQDAVEYLQIDTSRHDEAMGTDAEFCEQLCDADGCVGFRDGHACGS